MRYKRIIQLPNNNSFFLFGARGTGKSTLLKALYPKAYVIDLLDIEVEEEFAKHPQRLKEIVLALPNDVEHIVIDEIQKLPKLLDYCHMLIESTNKKFILTGSSAKKLKKGGANLLAGRAFVYNLFPLSFLELKEDFQLPKALAYGTLPKIFQLNNPEEFSHFLRAYAQVYLREEVWIEQLVRNLDPFRKFLEVAAQCNGKIINIAAIAKDVGVDDKTIVSYYNILEDTLLGFFLEPYQHSFRKRLSKKPKFFLFDTGVTRSLCGHLSLELKQGTSIYGETFEQFIICELYRLRSYFKPDYKLSYLMTKDGVEIDLIIERTGKKPLLIEIKSTENVTEKHLKNLENLSKDFGECDVMCLSNDKEARIINNIPIFPWKVGIKKIFELD